MRNLFPLQVSQLHLKLTAIGFQGLKVRKSPLL